MEPGVDVHGIALNDEGPSHSTPSSTPSTSIPVYEGQGKGNSEIAEGEESKEDLLQSGPHAGADPCTLSAATPAASESRETTMLACFEEEDDDNSPEAEPEKGVRTRGMDSCRGRPIRSGMLTLARTPVPRQTDGRDLAGPQAEEEEEDSPGAEGEPLASAHKLQLEWRVPPSAPSDMAKSSAAEGPINEDIEMEEGGMHAPSSPSSACASPGFGRLSGFGSECSGLASSWEAVGSSGLEDNLGGFDGGCDGGNGGRNDPVGVSQGGGHAELTITEILDALHSGCGCDPSSHTPKLPLDSALELWKDCEKLQEACTILTVKSKDLCINIFLWTRLTGMARVLNLYLDPVVQYTWTEASLVVARVQGSGENKVRNLHKWVLDFIQVGDFPSHKYRGKSVTIEGKIAAG